MFRIFVAAALLLFHFDSIAENIGSENIVNQFLSQMVTSPTKIIGREEKTKLMTFFSQKFFEENGVNPFFLDIDNFSFDRYEVINSFGPFVDVKVHDWICPHYKNCEEYYFFIRLKTVKENGHYKIYPSNLFDGKYIQWHWTVYYDNYIASTELRSSINNQKPTPKEYINFVDKYFSMLVNNKVNSSPMIDKIRFLDEAFFINKNIDPTKVEIPIYRFDKYEVVDTFGSFVDVSVGYTVFRVKVKKENGKLSIVPSLYNKDKNEVHYWWSKIDGIYEKPSSLIKYLAH